MAKSTTFSGLERFSGGSILLLSAIIYATFGVLARGIAHMLNTPAQVFGRVSLAAVIVFMIGLLRHKALTLGRRNLTRAVALGISFTLMIIFFTISVLHTAIATTVFSLFASSVISSLLIGLIFFKEQLTTQKVLAILLALAGLATYAGELVSLDVGMLAGVASGVFEGISNGIRKTLKGVDRTSLVLWQCTAGAVLALGWMVIAGGPLAYEFSWSATLQLVLFAAFWVALAHLLLYGFQHFDLSVGTVILTTELIFAALFGWLFFNEIPGVAQMIGGALIFGASLCTVYDPLQWWSALPGRFAKNNRKVAP